MGTRISSATTISKRSKIKLFLSNQTQTQLLMRYKQLITMFKQASITQKIKKKKQTQLTELNQPNSENGGTRREKLSK